MQLDETIDSLQRDLDQDLLEVSHAKDVEALKVKYLGKKGLIQGLMSSLRDASSEERPLFGKKINDFKEKTTFLLDQRLSSLEEGELESRLSKESLDITLPGKRKYLGRRHVALSMLDEAIEILSKMGFSVQLGPDIDTDWYNFESLNFAKDHPARDMQDTFYITSDILLRTHTSNTQARVMESFKPPIRVIAPGKAYRNEDVSSRSHVVFHQIEGMYIDKKVTFSDLLGTLEELFTKLLNKAVTMRFRPSYFPFVEPGVEVDIGCFCEGKGCSLCKHTGWLEVAGAGMIHPEVLKNGGIDPEEYQGYAFGFGPDRMTLLRHGIEDIRLFMENDYRFLEQF